MRPGYSSSSENEEDDQSSGDDAYAEKQQTKPAFMSPNTGAPYIKG